MRGAFSKENRRQARGKLMTHFAKQSNTRLPFLNAAKKNRNNIKVNHGIDCKI
jgi:hypothetical protein